MFTSLRFAPRLFLSRAVPRAHWVRSNSTLASTVSYRVAYHDKAATALLSPSENVKWDYQTLEGKIGEVAGGLSKLGYTKGDMFVTDIDQGTSSVLLQLAASHIGGQVLIVKNAADMNGLSQELYLKGAVMSDTSSFLNKFNFEIKNTVSKVKGQASEGVTDRDLDLACYGNSNVVTNREIYLRAVGMAGLLEIQPSDVVCVAAPPGSAFGMGSVVASFVRNATCYLPDMSKPEIADSNLMLAQEQQMEQLRTATKGAKLRGGCAKTPCEGTDLLHATTDLAGTPLRILSTGSGTDTMRPLFDACKDTYYSYK